MKVENLGVSEKLVMHITELLNKFLTQQKTEVELTVHLKDVWKVLP